MRDKAPSIVLVIPAKAGQIRLEPIRTTRDWPEGRSPWIGFAVQWLLLSVPGAWSRPIAGRDDVAPDGM